METEEHLAWRSVGMIKILNSHQDWFESQVPKKQRAYHALQSWLGDSEIQQFLGVNRYQGILWFNHEAFKELLWWMFTISLVDLSANASQSDIVAKEIIARYDIIRDLLNAEEGSGYQLERLIEAIKQ